MKSLFTLTRFIPEGFVIAKETPLAVVYRHPTELRAIAYAGKSNKRVWYFRFLCQSDMDKRIADLFMQVERHETRKEERKQEKKIQKAQAREQVKVGDIFHSSWGWEQTNCDYYQVKSLSGSFMVIQRIKSKMADREPTCSMSAYMLPVKDAFIEGEPELRKQTSFSPRLESYESCSLWDGKENYCSWYG